MIQMINKNPESETYHVPVLLTESIDGLITDVGGVYVDVTYGGGGHSREILKRLDSNGRLFAFDQDEESLKNKIDDERLILTHSNYRFFENYLRFYKVEKVHGILADIGVSWHQFDADYRGFSVRFEDAVLDMRMNRTQELDAKKILNEYDEKKLADVIYQYGELKNSRLIARKIVEHREFNPIVTLKDLKKAISSVLKPNLEKSILIQLFQALRIEVNDELGALKALLKSSEEMLTKEGRLVVISYHSLEDRLVKNYLRSGNFEGEMVKDFYGNVISPFKPLFSKPILPDKDEVLSNPRSRSARMRIGIKN